MNEPCDESMDDAPLIGPLSGYDLYLLNKYGGGSDHAECASGGDYPRDEDEGAGDAVITVTVPDVGDVLRTTLGELALRYRYTGYVGDNSGEILPFVYRDPFDPANPNAPRPMRRARIVVEDLGIIPEP